MWTETNDIEQLLQGVMRHGPNVLDNCLADPKSIKSYIERLDAERLKYPTPKTSINKDHWFIPDEYREIDIKEFCLSRA